MAETSTSEGVTSWSPIVATLLYSVAQGAVLFGFFQLQRNRDMDGNHYDTFEPRQYTRAHRSPPPFDGGKGLFRWARAAWKINDEDCLQFVGLDSYMFLRFLRMASRMTLLGVILSIFLIPVYATGESRGPTTEEFNKFTLARVGPGSSRLWVTVLYWYIFCTFIIIEMWREWKLYAKHRYNYLANGDVDTPLEFRYTIRVENIPSEVRSNAALKAYFNRLFPNQVRQAYVPLFATKLGKLIKERKKAILGYEKAVAFTKAKPNKPAPEVKKDGNVGCCGGKKVEAIPYYQEEIERLNREIDVERAALFRLADQLASNGGARIADGQDSPDDERMQTSGAPSSTGYVSFTNLRAKQAALQCEISGRKDRMDTFNVADPANVIWENVTTSLTRQKLLEFAATCFWAVGILFWAVPVSFVTSIANLNGILGAFGIPLANTRAAWYGVVAGLLPVIFLQVLMFVLYLSIVLMAKNVIRKKSMAEVDAYAFYWHQLFQFANLWLILIGGSLFNQVDSILNGETAIFMVIADAIPGGSTFFMNLIIAGTFGAFGLELSMLPTYGVKLILSLIQPEAQRTQRMLDDARTPPSIQWGKAVPGIVFVYLVSIMYMPIVPIVEVFAFVYFGGSYLVWKHQCMHVYATQFEGGGSTTWERLFGFLIGSVYMSQCVFIAYMGIKQGSIQASLGFVPLVLTIMFHFFLNRNVRGPLRNLSLEVAANIDESDGELPVDHSDEGTSISVTIEKQLYGQPSLKLSQDERAPLPYRRDETVDVESAQEEAMESAA